MQIPVTERLEVAEAFKNALPRKEDGTAIALSYKSLAAIKADIDKAIAAK
ncbi:hypothetical protein [Brevibacillus sp. AY1]|nr:hypothetical protein [Brevibacillus sp. AY1]MDH4619986.1 hypothetical protein [Brevibacillus sp. AY1]